MSFQLFSRAGLLTAAAAIGLSASPALAQAPVGMITGFEAAGDPAEVTYPTGYITGPLQFQDAWTGGTRFPRVLTKAEIEAELTASDLNPAGAVHSGNQAVIISKVDTAVETSGYLVRNTFAAPITDPKVTLDFWARPLTSGSGADPAGTPAGTNKIIGERQGNMFFGLMDDATAENRSVAIRFGVDTIGANPYTNVQERHIDYASATAVVGAPWIKSGLQWTADQWYNFRVDADFATKTYDFYVNNLKVNDAPIVFYTTAASNVAKFFVSRGTNQAGSIIDDVWVGPTANRPLPSLVNPDFDNDGDVDGSDFLVWQQGVNLTTGATQAQGDANGDGAVTAADLAIWKQGNGKPVAVAATAIPEPGCLVLALMAIAGGAACRQRRLG